MASYLTDTETKVLKALDAAPEKVLPFHDLRKAAGLTVRGAGIVLNRMEQKSLIAFTGGASGTPSTLTFKGIRTIREEIAA